MMLKVWDSNSPSNVYTVKTIKKLTEVLPKTQNLTNEKFIIIALKHHLFRSIANDHII